tara:strand:+ start:583 stop:792 length:210 start_codon:yes stop_codon:yes gene_type:complete
MNTKVERNIADFFAEDLVVDFYASIDRCKGEIDCINGNDAKTDQPRAYYDGYGQRFDIEQSATHWSEKQ